ncbi:19685_t:CDS:10 [Funneliformis geosporum]|uniref:19685_t:CDS:1 n=1 Tax=Funneliformis geosporum TaxID=1117311 RepID=A0A9W4SL54_9GLOM|nr:19685_t:CDS:10 [Funneliformis geosporum]
MATRVYIGRLARDARERDVEKLFRNYGTIREIKLMNGFGFVEFRDHRDADDVVYAFNGKSFMGENRFAPPQRNPQYRLIVENLSSSCSWQDLKDLMRKAGEVTFADCHKDRDGEGVVEFSSYEDMKNAIRKLDDTELKGKRIILREAPDNDIDREHQCLILLVEVLVALVRDLRLLLMVMTPLAQFRLAVLAAQKEVVPQVLNLNVLMTTTKPSSLVSQEIYTSTTTSTSSSNSPTNGESSVNSNNNLTEFLTTTTSTTPPSYSLLYCWTILCTYIASIFNKSTARLRRISTSEHAYIAQASIASSSSIDNISSLKAANSSIRLKNSTKPIHQSSLTSTPSFSSMMKSKTLILDLDETLIHSTSRGSRSDAHMIEVMVDNHACLYYVYKRPHVDHFLKKVSEWYKVVIFTASMPEYADPVIDWLDPNKSLIGNRYFRQSCTNRSGAYIKDLTIVEPDLSKVCLVDNSPISDPHDEALLDLLPFLDALRFTEDVRSILSLATY